MKTLMRLSTAVTATQHLMMSPLQPCNEPGVRMMKMWWNMRHGADDFWASWLNNIQKWRFLGQFQCSLFTTEPWTQHGKNVFQFFYIKLVICCHKLAFYRNKLVFSDLKIAFSAHKWTFCAHKFAFSGNIFVFSTVDYFVGTNINFVHANYHLWV